MQKKEFKLTPEVLGNLDHHLEPFEILNIVTGMNELLEIFVTETNGYAIRNVMIIDMFVIYHI